MTRWCRPALVAPQINDPCSFGLVPFLDMLGIVIREFHVKEPYKRSEEL